MCTYQTARVNLQGSGKGAQGWFPVTNASVYFDHPVHAAPEHTLNLDFLNPELGPSARVAVELDRGSALALAEAIRAVLEWSSTSPGGPVTTGPGGPVDG